MQNKSLSKKNLSIGKRSRRSRKKRHRSRVKRSFFVIIGINVFKWTFKFLELALVVAKLVDVLRDLRK